MAKLALILIGLAGCTWRYGLSASASVPVPGTYCEPITVGRMLCYQDDGVIWNCVDTGGYWSCTVMS